ATLAWSGTLSNVGTIIMHTLGAELSPMRGDLTNIGTLRIAGGASFDGTGATLTNRGTLELANFTILAAPNGPTISNEAGGSVTGTGQLQQTGGTFSQGAGAITGTEPVSVDGGTLHYTGTGPGKIALKGSSTLT